MRHGLLLFAILAAGCGESSSAPATTTTSSDPTCAAPSVDVPAESGYPNRALIERRARELVTRDVDAHACLVRVVVRRERMLVEASHQGRTIRAWLAGSAGTPTESLAPHVAAHQLLRTLLDAGVESVVSNGRGVALGFADHGVVCYRAVGRDPDCVRTTSVFAFDTVTEPSARLLVVRSLSDPSTTNGAEWELAFGDATTLAIRSGALQSSRPIGTPPPELDRFARVHASTSEAGTVAREQAAQPLAQAMPIGATTVRLETRTVGTTRVVLLSRCEGMIAHCVSVVATGQGATWAVAPSFATDPARIDTAQDASALAPGALRVRIREAGFHEASTSELFVVMAGSDLSAHEIALGGETARGDEETITEGCYRTLSIEAPSRVRLSDAQGWSGSHSEARGWNVVTSHTCAPEVVLCLDPASGFGPCT